MIAHVVHTLDGGGTERMLVSLLRRLRPPHHKHVVITLREPGPLAATLPDHVACRPIGAGRRSHTAWLRLAEMVNELGCRIVHARNTGCWADAILAASLVPPARLVLGFHGLDSGSVFDARRKWIARAGRACGARFASVSDCGRQQLMAQVNIPAAAIDVLPNGVDLQRFAAATSQDTRVLRHELGILADDFVVGMVGSLTTVKGHDVALQAVHDAWRAHPRLRLLIVGDGPRREALSALTAELGMTDRVIFAGFRPDVSGMLGVMDVFLCSSHSEGMSNAVLEAMAAGLPIVATDVGDNRKLIGGGHGGLVVEAGSVSDIAAAVTRVVDNPGLRRELAESARRRSLAYDLQGCVDRYQAYYDALLAAKSPSTRTEGGPTVAWDAHAADNVR